jgi:nuclease-like protein
MNESPVTNGQAGGSAYAEYERRRLRDAAAVMARHPHIGRLLLAMRNERQSTSAWRHGAEGEQRVGAQLDALRSGGAAVLHDRRVPGSRANVDHVVIATSGVWVVDTKHYTGEVRRRDVGGWLRQDERLYVGRRDCTRLVTGMTKQVAAVTQALGTMSARTRPVLCFTGAEWSLFAQPFELDGVLIAWPRALVKTIRSATGAEIDVASITKKIAAHLPAATRSA